MHVLYFRIGGAGSCVVSFLRFLSLTCMSSLLLIAGAASAATVYSIDINSAGSPTEPGFVGLDGSNGSSVTDQGVTFTVYGSEGTRDRGIGLAENDLTRDFAFNDSTEQVGLEITGLTAGLYQASIWSFEGSGAEINVEFLGYETNIGTFSENPGITLDQATDPARVFTIDYDPATDGDLRIFTQGIEGFQCVGCPRARFNALQLSVVPLPAGVLLFASALGLLGWMRRKTG